MTAREARQRVALLAWQLVDFVMPTCDCLIPDDCSDADVHRIRHAHRQLCEQLLNRAGPAYDRWREGDQRILDRFGEEEEEANES